MARSCSMPLTYDSSRAHTDDWSRFGRSRVRYNSRMTRRRWLVLACGAVAVGLAAVAGYVLSVRQAGEDVRGSATVEFVTTDVPVATAQPPSSDDATRLSSGRRQLPGPPTASTTGGLASHPTSPSVHRSAASGRSGAGRCSSSRPPSPTAASISRPSTAASMPWTHAPARPSGATGRGAAAGRHQPSADRLVYVTFIGRRSTCGDSVPGRDGIVVAYDADSGKVVWQRTTGPNESSPLVVARTRLRR